MKILAKEVREGDVLIEKYRKRLNGKWLVKKK
jgi:hypothetical protein